MFENLNALKKYVDKNRNTNYGFSYSEGIQKQFDNYSLDKDGNREIYFMSKVNGKKAILKQAFDINGNAV